MSWRGGIRRFFPYLIAIVGGFLAAYLFVAFIVFPAGVIPQDLKVPNVIGLDYDQAAQRLDQAGFKAERGESPYHETAPKGTVLGQNPPAGTKDVSGATVTLSVSAGQRSIAVPEVVGVSREQAERALRDAGLDVGDVSEQPSDQPLGTVIAATPRPGSQASSTVALVVSAGPNVVQVPDVVGRTVAQARLLLRQVGLGVGAVNMDPNAIADAAAAVVSQTPAAGSQAAAGSKVELRVGSRR